MQSQNVWSARFVRVLMLVGVSWLLSARTLSAKPADESAVQASEQTTATPVGQNPEQGIVNLGDAQIVVLRSAYGGKGPMVRAQAANRALSAAVDEPEGKEVRVEYERNVALIYLSTTPIMTLTEEDAKLEGEPSLRVFADAVTAALRKALASEARRTKVAELVLSSSLVVFLALIALGLMRRVSDALRRLRAWLDSDASERSLHLGSIELMRPEVFHSIGLVGVGLLRIVAKVGILYAWLAVVLSLFDATRGYTAKLTEFVLAPLSGLLSRLVSSFPVLLLSGLAITAVVLVLRFVGALFTGIAHRERASAWVASDLAAPVSLLVRAAIIVAALLFVAPVITGSKDGPWTWLGLIVTASAALAATPLLASGIVGIAFQLSRRLRVGEHVRLGAIDGVVREVGLLSLTIERGDGRSDVVPHLALLHQSVSRPHASGELVFDVAVDVGQDPQHITDLLTGAVQDIGASPRVQLLAFDAHGATYRVQVTAAESLRSALAARVLNSLQANRVALGQRLGNQQ